MKSLVGYVALRIERTFAGGTCNSGPAGPGSAARNAALPGAGGELLRDA